MSIAFRNQILQQIYTYVYTAFNKFLRVDNNNNTTHNKNWENGKKKKKKNRKNSILLKRKTIKLRTKTRKKLC